MRVHSHKQGRRQGTAAAELAVCLPLILFILAGLWEVGRIAEVSNVMWNSTRETARDGSLGSDNLTTLTNNLLTYLQAAEPTAFGTGHTTSVITPPASISSTFAANTTGMTCWDNTANRELFTLTFSDLTNTSVTDPTNASQLDELVYGVGVPYAGVCWSPAPSIGTTTRIYVSMTWVSMVDSPFTLPASLPAQ